VLIIIVLNGRSLVRKPEFKRPVGKLRRLLENNVKIDLQEIRWEIVD
jgi:hypothetical protein